MSEAIDSFHQRLIRELGRLGELVPGAGEWPVDRLRLSGTASFASCFDVDTAALAAAAASNLAAGVTDLDRDRVEALFTTRVEIDGRALPKWADLSGYYRTATDGIIQFHANFPHHAAGLVERLGCAPDRDAIQAAVLGWDPDELEAQLIADGMVAARMRTLDEWAAHPHARATEHLPLITVEQIGDAPPRPADPDRALRVLDCSRVLAGPVTGMTLAAHGADVLRVGAAHLPSVELCVAATGFGKRNTNLDLTTATGAAAFGDLLDSADVWIDGYRPGALASHGFPAERIGPGGVVVQISAFDGSADTDGPWAGRRGYDSIVQTTTGIVAEGTARRATEGTARRAAEGTARRAAEDTARRAVEGTARRAVEGTARRAAEDTDRPAPTPLPVQALDYCTGLLGAFAALRLAQHQARVGGTWVARLSLLRTRNWLVGLAPPADFDPSPAEARAETLHTVNTEWGRLTAPRPIGGHWPTPPQPLGTAEPAWQA
jgi:crotonobetainyl-CoA:carnitine CoA-transferase CaiB-like acyl-CoA transferase